MKCTVYHMTNVKGAVVVMNRELSPESADPFGFTELDSKIQLIALLSCLQFYCLGSLSQLSYHHYLLHYEVVSKEKNPL